MFYDSLLSYCFREKNKQVRIDMYVCSKSQVKHVLSCCRKRSHNARKRHIFVSLWEPPRRHRFDQMHVRRLRARIYWILIDEDSELSWSSLTPLWHRTDMPGELEGIRGLEWLFWWLSRLQGRRKLINCQCVELQDKIHDLFFPSRAERWWRQP